MFWPNQLSQVIIDTLNIVEPVNQALTTWLVLCGYAGLVGLLVALILILVERPDE